MGYGICVGFECLSIVSCVIYGLACWWQNRAKARRPRDLSLTEYEKAALRVSFDHEVVVMMLNSPRI